MTNLNQLKPVYYPSECNIEGELFVPVLKESASFDCMTAYFSSGSLEELAEPIITYLKNPKAGKLRFIMGPDISPDDYEAIALAVKAEKRRGEQGIIASSNDVDATRWQDIFKDQDDDDPEDQACLICSL